jgi:hypothetical protein
VSPVLAAGVIWKVVNIYISHHVTEPQTFAFQTYDGISLSKVIDVLTFSGNISYQGAVTRRFIKALLDYRVLLKGGSIIAVVTAFLILLGFVRRHLPASVGSNDARSSSVGNNDVRSSSVGNNDVRSSSVGSNDVRSSSDGNNDVRSNGAGSMEGESVHSESVHPELIHLAKAGLNNQDEQRDMLILEIWTVIAAVLYSAFMYILYLTSFYEEEALVLTSYGRYYGTFIIALIYMAVEVCWYCSYSFRYVKVRVTASALVLYLLFLHPDVFEKAFLPVRMDTDNDYFYEYRDCGSYIAS